MTEDEMVGWHHRLDGCEFNKLTETVKDIKSRNAAVHGVRVGYTLHNRNYVPVTTCSYKGGRVSPEVTSNSSKETRDHHCACP